MNTSQSPWYTLPPGDNSDDKDLSSMPDLVTPRRRDVPLSQTTLMTQVMKPMTMLQLMTMPNQNSFQDKDRQKTLAQGLAKELHKAPWKKQLATGPLDDLKKMTKTVKPIYEGFWYNSDQDILARLDQASKKLKERRSAQPQDNQEDDNAMPATPNLEKEPLPRQ